MAAGCDDCLRGQFGFLPEADYPYATDLQAPEPVYCVDGVPSLTPHKGAVGPFVAKAFWSSALDGAGAIPLTGLTPTASTPIEWVNETAYDVNVAVMTSGPIVVVTSASGTGDLVFRYGFDITISAPAVSETVSTPWHAFNGIAASSTVNGQMVYNTVYPISSGGSLTMTPYLAYTRDAGIVPQLQYAELSILVFGGAA